jgi:hypothetical protein
MRLCIARIILISLMVAAVPAAAQFDVYDNGPTDGYTLGQVINFGVAVSDQFTLGGNTNITGITFAAWLFPGDFLESVDVSVTSSEFGGTSYFDQTVNFTASGCFSNGGFNVCNESGTIAFGLGAGSYWLNLSNAVSELGNPVYWDQNSGPSLASNSSVGTIPSESFSLFGFPGGCGAGSNAPDCPPPPTSPEPGSLLLFGSGVMALSLAGSRKYL